MTLAPDNLMHPSLPVAMKLKIHKYTTERKMTLGTKGSRTMIKAYVFADVEFANFKRTMRFDIANIAGYIVLGRGVMREHSITVTFNPDVVTALNAAGTPLKFPLVKRKRTFLAMENRDGQEFVTYDGPVIPVPLPVIENDEVLLPDVNDESSMPVFVSAIAEIGRAHV